MALQRASVGADSISARITAAICFAIVCPPAAPASCTPRQCGSQHGQKPVPGHSARRSRRALRAAGRLKFQQTARGALHSVSSVPTAGQQTVLAHGPGRKRPRRPLLR